MGRDFEMEQRFSSDLDCLLAGGVAGPGVDVDVDYRKDIQFAEKMIRERINPSPSFEARLQHKLLIRLSQREAVKLSLWEKLDIILRRWPWRLVMPVIAILLLITSILYGAGIIPQSSQPSAVVAAASIAEHSPQVRASFDDEKIQVTHVIQIIDQQGTVIMQSRTKALIAKVDLKSKVVTEIIQADVPEFTTEDEQAAIALVMEDSQARALFDQGATITKVNPGHSISPYEVTDSNGQVQKKVRVETTAEVRIKLGKSEWSALVDPAGGRVFNVLPVGKNFGFVGVIDIFRRTAVPIIAGFGFLILAGLWYYKRLRKSAGIFSILLGLLAIPAVLYASQYTVVKLTPVILIPLTSIITAVIAVKNGHKWPAIAGIILSVLAIAYLILAVVALILSNLRIDG